jgi:hypothetical protein
MKDQWKDAIFMMGAIYFRGFDSIENRHGGSLIRELKKAPEGGLHNIANLNFKLKLDYS